MSSVTASTDMSQVKPEELPRFLDILVKDIVAQINGKLDFQTNFNAKLVSVVFASGATDTTVAHGLGRTPAGYITTTGTAPVVVYNGSVGANTSTLTLRSSGAATVGLLIF